MLQWGRSDFLRINSRTDETDRKRMGGLQWGRSDFLRINNGIGCGSRRQLGSFNGAAAISCGSTSLDVVDVYAMPTASMGPQRFPADQPHESGDGEGVSQGASMGPQRFPADQLYAGIATLGASDCFNGAAAISCGSTASTRSRMA